MPFPTLAKSARGSKLRRRPRSRPIWLQCERLDQRLVCASLALSTPGSTVVPGLPLEVEMVAPVVNPEVTSMGVATSTQPAFSLRFNFPINGFLLDGDDFLVEQADTDGSWVQLPFQNARFDESIDPTDPTSRTILIAFSAPLNEGTYRLVLSGQNDLVGVGGHSTSQVNQVLNTFSVGEHSTDSRIPMDLGLFNASESTRYVSVGKSSQSTPMTRFSLTSGMIWSLSSRFAEQDPTHFQVSLFNAQQQLVISTPGSSLNTIDQSLVPGTYYLQVLWTNLEANDPPRSLGITFTGTVDTGKVPAIQSLIPLNFNHVSANPDSLLVQFAGSTISPTLLQTSASVYSLVDSGGKVWPIQPTAYDPNSNKLALIFSSNLPTGRYTLQVTLGDSPDSTGTVTTQLGSFNTILQPRTANDLGSVFPSDLNVTWKNTTRLEPGQTTAQVVSILHAQQYRISLSNSGISALLIRQGAYPENSGEPVVVENSSKSLYDLDPGSYVLIATNQTAAVQDVAFAVTPIPFSNEALSLGGVGQMPSFTGHSSLLGGSIANIPDPMSATILSQQPTAPVSNPGSDLAGTQPVESSGSFSLLSLNQVPVGSFSTPAESSVPSSLNPGAVVVALNSTMLLNQGTTVTNPPRGNSKGISVVPAFSHRRNLESVPQASLPTTSEVLLQQEVTADLSGPFPHRRETVVVPTRAETTKDAPVTRPQELTDSALWSGVSSEIIDNLRSDPESSAIHVEVAGLASPLGIIVAGCVIYHRVKHARPSLLTPPWNRPWNFSRRSR